MINSKTYTPRINSRIHQVLKLMSDERVRSRTEICETLGLQVLTYQRTKYERDDACVDCKIRYHAYAHLRVIGEQHQFSGASQLFIRMTAGGDYRLAPPMLKRVGRGHYKISRFGRTALRRAARARRRC